MPHYPRTAGSRDRARSRRSSSGPSATSGCCACGCGPTAARALRRGRADPRPGACPAASARAAFALRAGVERVDEVAEDVQPRVDDPLAGRLERRALARPPRRGRRPRPRPAWSRTATDGEDPDAGPNGQRERIGRPGIDLDRRDRRARTMIRAWKVSSASSEMTTRSICAPSSSSVVANRSWVSGRSGVRPCRLIAIELASHGPIQIGR